MENTEWDGAGLPPVGTKVMCANAENGNHTLVGVVKFCHTEQVCVEVDATDYGNGQVPYVTKSYLEVYSMGDVSPFTSLTDELTKAAIIDCLVMGEDASTPDKNVVKAMINCGYRKVPRDLVKTLRHAVIRNIGAKPSISLLCRSIDELLEALK